MLKHYTNVSRLVIDMEEFIDSYGWYIIAGIITLVVLITCCTINRKLLS